ncbi:hypothetical protein TPAR_06270 [Tolypocladium paradoxum]|uniref:Uncharacterized protein n=1 Tax=Tolypocladium paradoxum TaxID=94208 RepID=A0A2S4KTR7_9HYPO|nr:hypothetical protein TPAR_06270 [Tolypocladium paradoxum]
MASLTEPSSVTLCWPQGLLLGVWREAPHCPCPILRFVKTRESRRRRPEVLEGCAWASSNDGLIRPRFAPWFLILIAIHIQLTVIDYNHWHLQHTHAPTRIESRHPSLHLTTSLTSCAAPPPRTRLWSTTPGRATGNAAAARAAGSPSPSTRAARTARTTAARTAATP